MIQVEHLTKYYGDHAAVRDLSFTIGEGHVYGFLGPNGAGKSTTMNIMTGCLSATAGKVTIDGHDIFEEPKAAKRLIGYLPEQPPLYVNETPEEYLTFVGEAKGLRGEELHRQIENAVTLTRIENVRGKRIAALSKGYKQRVGIAQALLGDPKVIILDEPTVGLDPIQIIEIRDLIRELGRERTVIFSSHILSEVQTICDEILMIAHGRLVAFDTPDKLESSLLAPNEITFTAMGTPDEVRPVAEGAAGVTDLTLTAAENGMTEGHCRADGEDIYAVSRALFFAFADARRALVELRLKKANLEDIFLELAGESASGAAGGQAAAPAEGEAAAADAPGVCEIDAAELENPPEKPAQAPEEAPAETPAQTPEKDTETEAKA